MHREYIRIREVPKEDSSERALPRAKRTVTSRTYRIRLPTASSGSSVVPSGAGAGTSADGATVRSEYRDPHSVLAYIVDLLLQRRVSPEAVRFNLVGHVHSVIDNGTSMLPEEVVPESIEVIHVDKDAQYSFDKAIADRIEQILKNEERRRIADNQAKMLEDRELVAAFIFSVYAFDDNAFNLWDNTEDIKHMMNQTFLVPRDNIFVLDQNLDAESLTEQIAEIAKTSFKYVYVYLSSHGELSPAGQQLIALRTTDSFVPLHELVMALERVASATPTVVCWMVETCCSGGTEFSSHHLQRLYDDVREDSIFSKHFRDTSVLDHTFVFSCFGDRPVGVDWFPTILKQWIYDMTIENVSDVRHASRIYQASASTAISSHTLAALRKSETLLGNYLRELHSAIEHTPAITLPTETLVRPLLRYLETTHGMMTWVPPPMFGQQMQAIHVFRLMFPRMPLP